MADLNFPTNPNDGDTYVFDGKTYVYNASNDQWKIQTTGSTNVNLASLNASIVPASNNVIDLGSSSKMFADLFVGSSATLPANTTIDDKNAGIGLEVYANTTVLPMSGDVGRLAFVESNKRVYLWNGLVWYHVFNASSTNDAPYITSRDPMGQYYLNGTTGANVEVEIIAQDPENGSLTFDYDVTVGALGDTVVTQSNNIFTITPSSSPADAGSFELTFSVTDGLNIVNRTSLFSLAFTYDWQTPGTLIDNWVGANTTVSSQFGYRLAMDGYHLAVGSANDLGDGLSTGDGNIYIYDILDTSNITQSQVIKAPSSSDDTWGDVMVLEANTLVVGSESFNGATYDDTGRVMVYRRDGQGEFSLLQTIEGEVLSDNYGKDVWLSDDGLKLFVARDREVTGSIGVRGAVDILTRGDRESTFTLFQTITPSGLSDWDEITTVRYNDKWDEIFLGYPASDNWYPDAGAVVVFEYDSGTDTYTQKQAFGGNSWGAPVYIGQSNSDNRESQSLGLHMATRGDFFITRRRENYNYQKDVDIIYYRDSGDGYWKYKEVFYTDDAQNTDWESSTRWAHESWEDEDYVYFGTGKMAETTYRGSVSVWKIDKTTRQAWFGLNTYLLPNAYANGGCGFQVDPIRGLIAIGAYVDDVSGMSDRGRVYLYEV